MIFRFQSIDHSGRIKGYMLDSLNQKCRYTKLLDRSIIDI